ncbi:UNVERIFIED_CONTAM: Transposable element Tcb2 transposase [Trichonephila clavipes]
MLDHQQVSPCEPFNETSYIWAFRVEGPLQNNATTHTSKIATKCLQEPFSELRHFLWPPKSPDRNIIEHILNALQRTVQKRSPSHLTPTDLCTALQDLWCQLPPELLQTIIKSMPRRVTTFLRARQDLIRY